MYNRLKEKIEDKEAQIGVLGLGYVGLPLAVEFSKKGFEVTGFEIDHARVKSIMKSKKSYILDVPNEDITMLVDTGLLTATDDFKKIRHMDVVIICVPTPLRKTKEPDISFIVDAAEKISKYARSGQLIILESTTYPGTTDEILLPILKRSNLILDKDFFLVFSPERVDPGNPRYKTRDITKIVGGVTSKSAKLAQALYSFIIRDVKIVSSSKTAEMVKLLENTFRSVNIGLVNELALMCNCMNIDVWEVIEAAKSKPFGFIPFYPGPGLGGHCIPIDPIYLSWKARLYGFEARFIELADMVNSYMPQYIVRRISEILNKIKKPLMGSKVLIVGITYKRNVNDTRESPALEIIRLLEKEGCNVSYFDPYISKLNLNGKIYRSVKITPELYKGYNCTVIVTDHSSIDYDDMVKNANIIFDTRNTLSGFKSKKIVRL